MITPTRVFNQHNPTAKLRIDNNTTMIQSLPSRWMILTLSIFLLLSLLQSSSTTSVVLANERATSDMLKEDRNYVRFTKIAYYPYSPNLLQFNDTDIEGQSPSSCTSSWTMDHVLTLYIPKHEINIQAKYFINDCKTYVCCVRGVKCEIV